MSDHVERNRREWNRWAPDWVAPGRRDWASPEILWGALRVPEAELQVLGDVRDKDVLELGCGTGYFSSWLGRRGARVVGLDVSDQQLATAQMLQVEFGYRYPLFQASAENAPFADQSFDLLISEYGASIWADPYVWVPEGARLLRPGGQLIFLVNGILVMLCMPDEDVMLPVVDQLVRPFFGIHRFDWKTDESAEFHIGHGAWIRLLRANGFEVEDLIELQAPDTYTETRFGMPPKWARQWPAEEVWKARKRA